MSGFKEFINNLSWKKEVVDQGAHFGVGVGGVLILALIFSSLGLSAPANVYIAAGIMFAIAVGREIYQRLERKDDWYSCEWGCRMDLVFWFLGITMIVLLLVL